MSETTSETTATAQEPAGGSVTPAQSSGQVTTSTAPASETAPAAQEQTVAPPAERMTRERIKELLETDKDLQAEIYRRAQSMKDQELHRERLRAQQEAEQRRIQEMDDEEYGRYLREQADMQSRLQQEMTPRLARVLNDVRDTFLSSIEDEEARAEVTKREANGEFQTAKDFYRAVVEAQAKSLTAKQLAREEARLKKELREAITKELTAEAADVPTPEIGRGLAAPRYQDLHGIDAIKAGLAQRRRQ
jgi:hypothetical protein